MSMLCYTRNFEDVMVQRALQEVTEGFYLDVGACMPLHDSNTYGLYTRDWRGIAIEPLLPFDLQRAWQTQRPRDMVLPIAVGQKREWLDFYVFDARQLSSGNPAMVEYWQRYGSRVEQQFQVLCRPLRNVLEQFGPRLANGAPGAIHLMSLDVEGMELAVLQGMDWQHYRPWILLIEAHLPGSQTESHAQWEPFVLQQGYHWVYSDGVNRFYVAQEHAHLARHFRYPPNVWDKFTRYRERQMEQHLQAMGIKVPA